MKWLLAGMVLLVYALHQDNWLARDSTLIFGVLPAELAYQAAYSVLAAITMAILVHYAWPKRLEEEAEAAEGNDAPMTRGAH